MKDMKPVCLGSDLVAIQGIFFVHIRILLCTLTWEINIKIINNTIYQCEAPAPL